MRKPANDDTLGADQPSELRRVPIIGALMVDTDQVRFYDRPEGYIFVRDGEVVGVVEAVPDPISPRGR